MFNHAAEQPFLRACPSMTDERGNAIVMYGCPCVRVCACVAKSAAGSDVIAPLVAELSFSARLLCGVTLP